MVRFTKKGKTGEEQAWGKEIKVLLGQVKMITGQVWESPALEIEIKC